MMKRNNSIYDQLFHLIAIKWQPYLLTARLLIALLIGATIIPLAQANSANTLTQGGFKKWQQHLYVEGTKDFIVASQQGDVEATYALAVAYQYGVGVPKDVLYAAQLITSLSHPLYPPIFSFMCLTEIGLFTVQDHNHGLHSEASCTVAFEDHSAAARLVMSAINGYEHFNQFYHSYIPTACKQNDPLACALQKDPQQAQTLFQQTQIWMKHSDIAQALATAGFRAWKRWYFNNGTLLFTKAFELGNIPATYALAIAYFNGIGVDDDTTLSFKLLSKAVHQDYPPAKGFLCAISVLFFEEHSTLSKDSLYLLCQTAAKDHAIIGKLVLAGIESHNQFNQFFQQNIPQACQNNDPYACILQQDPDQAKELYQKIEQLFGSTNKDTH